MAEKNRAAAKFAPNCSSIASRLTRTARRHRRPSIATATSKFICKKSQSREFFPRTAPKLRACCCSPLQSVSHGPPRELQRILFVQKNLMPHKQQRHRLWRFLNEAAQHSQAPPSAAKLHDCPSRSEIGLYAAVDGTRFRFTPISFALNGVPHGASKWGRGASSKRCAQFHAHHAPNFLTRQSLPVEAKTSPSIPT